MAASVYGDSHGIMEQMRDGNTLFVLVGDSHSSPESTFTLERSIAKAWDVPFTGRHVARSSTFGCEVLYPSGSYTQQGLDGGNGMLSASFMHAPHRIMQLAYTSDPANSQNQARFRLEAGDASGFFRGDWYSNHAMAGKAAWWWDGGTECIQKFATRSTRAGSNGTAVQYDYTGSPPAAGVIWGTTHHVIEGTPGSGDPEIGVWSDNASYVSTGRYFLSMQAFLWRHDGSFTSLGNPVPGFWLVHCATPGWETTDHAAATGGNSDRWYSDAALNAWAAGFTSIDATKQVVIGILLGHDDGGTTKAQWKTNIQSIISRYRTAFGAGAMVLLIQPWHSPTSTTARHDDLWAATKEICDADPLVGGVSVALKTNYLVHAPPDFSYSTIPINASAVTFTTATKRLEKIGIFASYDGTGGAWIYVSGGTGVTPGWYYISSKNSDNGITLDDDIGGTNPTDVTVTDIRIGYLDSTSLHVENDAGAVFMGEQLWSALQLLPDPPAAGVSTRPPRSPRNRDSSRWPVPMP